MNRAVSGHFQPGAKENVAYLTQTERRREIEARAAQEKKDYEVCSEHIDIYLVLNFAMIYCYQL